MAKTALVVTSIAEPNEVLHSLAAGARQHEWEFWVIGDVVSPQDFSIEGCRFMTVQEQEETGLRTARISPKRHYARKNIGYLLAIRWGAEIIVETDDDNFPREGFWGERRRTADVRVLEGAGWVNVYRYFSDLTIWPRGFPLEE